MIQKGRLLHAGGGALKNVGKCVLDLQIDSFKVSKEVMVADIKDDVLLGMDILKGANGKPADIMLSQEKIILNGNTIKCTHYSDTKLRKVTAADHYILPGHTEQVIDAYVERYELDDKRANADMIIEPSEKFHDKHPVLVASSVININTAPTVKVRLINPFPYDVSIKQDTVVAQAEFIASTPVVLCKHENGDPSMFSSIRRIQIDRQTQSNVRQVVSSKNHSQNNTTHHTETIPDHLKELYSDSIIGKSHKQRKALEETLIEYQDVFSKHDNDLGFTHLAEHTIDTDNARPIKQPFRRVPLAYEQAEKEAIDKMLEQDVIRPSSSPWASPLVLVKKKDGSVRPCVDYRLLNKVTKVDAFPIPKVDDCIDSISGAKLFSTLDLTSGYFQIPLKEEDIPKSAFTSKYGLYEFKSLPFGMVNSGATFERVMELALKGLQWQTCIIYIDDCIVFGQTFDDHMIRLKEVLDRFRQANLKLKPKKCELIKTEVTFLGHRVTEHGIKPDPSNVSKVLAWKTPENVTEVKQFLGLCGYYRKYVKNFSSKAQPLYDLTKNDSTLKWNDKCEVAFNTLKGALTNPDFIALPTHDGEFILDCDACNTGIGAVLSQVQDGHERVVAYGSRSLSKAEKNFCVTDKELLAIRFFIEYYRHYLLGRQFTVRSDHRALHWLFSMKNPNNRIARWIEYLSGYTFSIEYRKGSKHGNADSLSRCPNPQDCSCSNFDPEELKCGPCNKCKKRAIDMEAKFKQNIHISRCTFESQNTHTHFSVEMIITVIMKILMLFMLLLGETVMHGASALHSIKYSILYIWTLIDIYMICQAKRSMGLISAMSWTWKNVKLKQWSQQVKVRIKRFFTDFRTAITEYDSLGKMCRSVTTRSKTDFLESYLPWSSGYSIKDLQDMQMADKDIGQVINWFKVGSRPTGDILKVAGLATRHYVQCWDALVIKNGLLMRKFTKKDNSGSFEQLVVPRELQRDVLHQMHNSLMSGHLGCKKTREKLLQRYYWYGVREDVYLWIEQCDNCGSNKAPSKSPKMTHGSMQVGSILDRFSTDLLGPLPETPRRNRFILTVTDHFSHWVEIIPIPDQSAETTARVILNEVIARFGCPLSIHSDQGSNYESKIFAELCEMLEIRKTRTSPRNPKCNGQTERFNKTLTRMIRAYLTDCQTDWDLNLGCLAAAYRATPNDTTKLTPNLIMLGREVRLPAEIVFGSTTHSADTVTSYGQYVQNIKQKMQKAHEICRENLHKCAIRQKCRSDSDKQFHTYKTGDIVWYLNIRRKEAICTKLQTPYTGPFLIQKKLSEHNYVIQLSKSKTDVRVVHYDKLKPYKGTSTPKWIKGNE